MTFTEVWHTLVDECEDLSAATFVAPLSERRFRITELKFRKQSAGELCEVLRL